MKRKIGPLFSLESLQNQRETDPVSIRFVLKRKHFFKAIPPHPRGVGIKNIVGVKLMP
jgi:hypothetical protein